MIFNSYMQLNKYENNMKFIFYYYVSNVYLISNYKERQ